MAFTYVDFQKQSASEKIGLVQLDAAKRLMGFELHSGSVYKLTNFDVPVIVSLEENGVAYSATSSAVAMATQTYFNDRTNKILYVRTSASVNPNGIYLALTLRLFFAGPGHAIAPHNLSAGFDVEWKPLLKETSEFGVENEIGLSVEGSGSITLFNDPEYWDDKIEKLYFENQQVQVYSWNRQLPITEAKLLYRGKIQTKTYDSEKVTFGLKDPLVGLREPLPLVNIGNYPNARVTDSQKEQKQRQIFGYVYGHRPVNIDQILDGYPLTGTVQIPGGTNNLIGTGTLFTSQLSIGDEVIIDGSIETTITSITANNIATLGTTPPTNDASGLKMTVKPRSPYRFANRKFLVAGHPLREPNTFVTFSPNSTLIEVNDPLDFRAGDEIRVGIYTTTVESVSGYYLRLSISLPITPTNGTIVIRPPVSNVRINDRLLQYTRDYTYDAFAGTLTLTTTAEFNVAPTYPLKGTVSFVTGSTTVTGSGTLFTSELKSGDWIKSNNDATYFEVLSIESETSLTLRSAATYNRTNVSGTSKSPVLYVEGQSVLSCDVIGRSDFSGTTFPMMVTAPQIVYHLLRQAGLNSLADVTSFENAESLLEQRLGFVVPEKVNDRKPPIIRDLINKINQSVMSALILNKDFKLEYITTDPSKQDVALKLAEDAILSLSVQSNSSSLVKTSVIEYGRREYEPYSKESVIYSTSSVSDNVIYLAKTGKEFRLQTYLVDESDAYILANRWGFVLEMANSILTIKTKLQASRIKISDKISIYHPKLFNRLGSSDKRKVGAVERAVRTLSDSSFELTDLSNAFTRCAAIAQNSLPDYSSASEEQKAFNGFITDDYGMINNNPETFGINLIW